MEDEGDEFSRKIGANAARKLKAQRRATRNIWFGFGMFGLIGWSVAVPTLLGAGLGLWLDKHYPSRPVLDADASARGFGDRMFQCVALGRPAGSSYPH